MDRVILHCDANNFYASVEIQKNPKLKGLPIAVCGDPEKRHGIVLAKSYEAKKLGVATGEPIWQAKEKCRDLVVVMPDFFTYMDFSRRLYQIYTEYTDMVESFGLDECWLDVTGSRRLFGNGECIANTIRERVKKELGITVSAGVSFTKIFAKLGSDYKKPDATTVFSRDNYQSVVWNLPVEEMLMVGRKTKLALNRIGIHTIGQLATFNPRFLKQKFGVVGEKLQGYALGIDNDGVKKYFEKELPLSVGNGTTTSQDMKTFSQATALIITLSEHICQRLRGYKLKAKGVHLNIKFTNLACIGKQIAADFAINTARALTDYAVKLLGELWSPKRDGALRALTVTAISLIDEQSCHQMNIFSEEEDKQDRLERSIDALRDKYGIKIVQKAILMEDMFVADRMVEEPDYIPFKGIGGLDE